MHPASHIAVVAASAPSHMYPHLAVIHELVRRGHRVSYLVGAHLADLVRPTGADVIGCTSVLPGAPGAPEAFDETDPAAGMRIFLDEAIHVLPQVHNALDADRPDVVLYDIGGMAGPVAAAYWGVPAAQLSPSEVAWDGYHEDMAEILVPIFNSPGGRAYREAFDGWLADSETGLTFDEVTGAPRRCLVLIPRIMQRHADRVGDRYRFVGPCIDPRRTDRGGWHPPAGDGPLALLAFGTAYTERADVYRNVIDALDGEGWRLVLAVGRAEMGAVPSWVQVQESVPQPAVLQRADCFITHAGMGSCTEGLWFGVPMVAIPQAVDQPANAARLESIGVGRHLYDPLPSVAQIRDAVLGITADQQTRLRLDAISAEIHAHGGPGHAADAVEDVAAGRW
ncbi:oleandomycin glycosyltransferase [Mycobacterium sp. NS-7484]|uniref:macrolide family glycosyltransferase n=1 Tax=Mycobacterium sp. NS-7484 TaxID=1834161 RepID=UPI00096D3953|nr:macrolide family glycosyltransferase [Mycobacterium sp. NS-7484]OMC00965.1 oleandomycin glycosyltransferase [Mycobacterium sp. NS-7484]